MQVLKATLSSIWANRFIVLTLVAIALLVLTIRTCSINHELNAKVIQQDHKFHTWVDSLGREHAKVTLQSIYTSQLSASDKALVDSSAKMVGTKSSSLQLVTKVVSKTQGHFKAIVDSEGAFAYTDSFLTIKGQEGTSMGLKTLSEDYTYHDTATYVVYKTHKRFLGVPYKSDQVLDVSFGNPNTEITGLRNISLKPYTSKKRWGIGPSIQATYDGSQFRYHLGIGIQYNLITF